MIIVIIVSWSQVWAARRLVELLEAVNRNNSLNSTGLIFWRLVLEQTRQMKDLYLSTNEYTNKKEKAIEKYARTLKRQT